MTVMTANEILGLELMDDYSDFGWTQSEAAELAAKHSQTNLTRLLELAVGR